MQYKYFTSITVGFTVIFLLSNIVSVKVVGIGNLAVPSATILFPLSYIFGDILTEVYGYKRSRFVIWTAFLANVFMVVVFFVVGQLPAAKGWENQAAYDAILGFVPRIVVASLVAFWVGEFANSYVLAKMKILTQGRHLWARVIGSTIVGEALDAFIFIPVAFVGALPVPMLLSMICTSYLLKVGIEVVCYPLTRRIVKGLKRREAENYFDYQTKFNPFLISLADLRRES